MKIEASQDVTLPVGILKDGVRYNKVRIDEMRAADHKIMTSQAFQRDVGKGLSQVLARIVQEIPGVLPAKKNLLAAVGDTSLFDEMCIADRQTILLQALYYSDEEPRSTAATCPHCGKANEVLHDLGTIEVVPVEGEGVIHFELPRGLPVLKDGERILVRKGSLRLPTGEDESKLAKHSHEGQAALLLRQVAMCAFDVELVGKLSPKDLELLSKKDFAYIKDLLGENTCGPDVVRKEACAYCSEEFEVAIDLAAFFK